ncbi:MAG: BlaI/MecI/CopY family transcriptional regulator [Pyrinomonadaceae bacterium]
MKKPRFMLRGFKRPHEIAVQSLGKLEREVLEEIWRRGEASVRDMHIAFEERTAYTTLMTTLDRLHKKGLLARRKDGRAFLYSARVSREGFEQSIAQDLIGGLLGGATQDVEPVLACIVEAVSDHDRDLLDELDRLVKEKRRELSRED